MHSRRLFALLLIYPLTIYWTCNSIDIATGYGLDGPGIESQWGAKFFAPVPTCPGAHPAYCTMGTRSFTGVKSGRGLTLTPHPLLVHWSWKSGAIPLLPFMSRTTVQIAGQVRKISSPLTGIRSPDRPVCSQSLYRLSYPSHEVNI
jgi:hypothetical protein